MMAEVKEPESAMVSDLALEHRMAQALGFQSVPELALV